jgi:hypothetical protein
VIADQATDASALPCAAGASYQLRANAIGLPHVLFQSITSMAPASAVAFTLSAAVPFAGGSLPLAVLLALVTCLLLAITIAQLAIHLPCGATKRRTVVCAIGGWASAGLRGNRWPHHVE